jgi:hypothetical protein
MTMEARKAACLKRVAKDGKKITNIKGWVINVEDKRGVDKMLAKWTSVENGKVFSTHTDSDGEYNLKLPRCDFFKMNLIKDGYADDTGVGACLDPYLMEDAAEVWNSGVTKSIGKNQLRAMLTWKVLKRAATNGGVPYSKDMDLHMEVSGKNAVLLPKYRKYAGKLALPVPLPKKGETKTFTDTDLGLHPDEAEEKQEGVTNEYAPSAHIYWQKTGNSNAYPYASYLVDSGSMFGNEQEGGGPEAIEVSRVLKKQYLVYVDCFSCDEFENQWGDDEKRPLTHRSLAEFVQSEATIKVVQGNEQISCRSVSSAKGHPHVRWDAMLINCGSHSGGWSIAGQLTGGARCTTNDINAFNQESPTVYRKK